MAQRDSHEMINVRFDKKLKQALEQEAKRSGQSLTVVFHRAVAAELRRRAQGGNPHREPLSDEEVTKGLELMGKFFDSEEGQEVLRRALKSAQLEEPEGEEEGDDEFPKVFSLWDRITGVEAHAEKVRAERKAQRDREREEQS